MRGSALSPFRAVDRLSFDVGLNAVDEEVLGVAISLYPSWFSFPGVLGPAPQSWRGDSIAGRLSSRWSKVEEYSIRGEVVSSSGMARDDMPLARGVLCEGDNESVERSGSSSSLTFWFIDICSEEGEA